MRQQSKPSGTAEQHVREIRRATRKQYSAEEKIRIVLAGLRGEHSIAELCWREGLAESLYYAWSKEFLEAGKKRCIRPAPITFGAGSATSAMASITTTGFRLATRPHRAKRRVSNALWGKAVTPKAHSPKSRHAVAYFRVSTAEQGHSGLGLEAQQASVRTFVIAQGWTLVGEFSDVASGKDDRRPGFQAALARCRQLGAVLVAARLDRITRRAHTLSQLLEDGVSLRAADMPSADDLMMRIYAAMAQKERELISARTKAALAAAKARGAVLGGDRGYRPVTGPDSQAATQGRREAAGRVAHRLALEVDALREEGISTHAGLAQALMKRGVETPRGGAVWTHTTVARVLARVTLEPAIL